MRVVVLVVSKIQNLFLHEGVSRIVTSPDGLFGTLNILPEVLMLAWVVDFLCSDGVEVPCHSAVKDVNFLRPVSSNNVNQLVNISIGLVSIQMSKVITPHEQ